MPFVQGALSGLLFSLAFPTVDAWYVAFVALAPFLLSLEALVRAARDGRPHAVRRGFGAGLGFGLGLYVPLLWWIVLLDAPALTIPWIRYPAPFAIALVESSATGLMGAAYVFVRARRPGIPAWLLAPSLWWVAEWLRGWGELGFPWGVLGYALVPFLPALQLASVAGLTGLTFWIVATNALVAEALAPGAHRLRPALIAAALFTLPIVWGAWRLSRPYEPETVRVALVQPDVNSHDKWRPENRGPLFESMAELTREGAEQGAKLVVWPETAAPCYLLKDEDWRPYVEALARGSQAAIFTGLPDYQVHPDPEGKRVISYTNTGALFGPEGKLYNRMDKIKLVPFGEHVPYSTTFPVLDRIDFGEADFIAGDHPVIFRLGDLRFANLVCFEAIFPDLTREYARLGAEILVNITNDSWFGAGAGAIAHRNMAVVRCVETGCGMARCANSGISAGIDAYGRQSGVTGLFERTVSVVDVPRRQGTTPFVRFGDWVGIAARLVALGSLLAAVAPRRKVR